MLDHVLVEPIRSGRLRNHDWPPGLGGVVAAAAGLCLVLVLATAASNAIRRHATLLFLTPNQTLPAVAVPLLLASLVFALTSLYTATLHVRAAVRVPVLVIVAAILLNGAAAEDFAPRSFAVLAGVAALLVFAVLRWRSSFSWWEFVVAAVLIGGTMVYTVVMVNLRYGSGVPGAALNSFITVSVTMWALAGPFSALAGATLTELTAATVTAVCSAGGRLVAQRPSGRALLPVALAVLAVARLGQIWWGFSQDDDDLRWSSVAWGALPFLVPFAAAAAWRALGQPTTLSTGADPEPTFADWRRWALVIAVVLVLAAVWTSLLGVLVTAVGRSDLARDLRGLNTYWSLAVSIPATALALAVTAVLVRRRTGRLSVVLVMFSWVLVVQTVFTLTQVTASTTGSLIAASLVATVLGVGWVSRGQLTTGRAVALASVLALTGLYEYRAVITEPLTALLALSGVSVGLLVGTIWRLLTDNGFSYGDSRSFPRPARVLLVVANAVFGASGIALLALQGGVSSTDLAAFERLGDSQLGFTLVITVLLVLLVGALDPSARDAASEA